MERMHKRILKPRLELNKLKLLLILSILVTLNGCLEPDAPRLDSEVKVWETAINPENGEFLCGEYKIDDIKNLKFSPIVDHPISQCAGVFGFKGSDFPKVIDHIKNIESYYQKKLDECKASK